MSIQQILQPSAQNEPWSKVYVNAVSTNAFKLSTNPVSSYVLTSDASGNGTWQVIPAPTPPGTFSSAYVLWVNDLSIPYNTVTFIPGSTTFWDATATIVGSDLTYDGAGTFTAVNTGRYFVMLQATFYESTQDMCDLSISINGPSTAFGVYPGALCNSVRDGTSGFGQVSGFFNLTAGDTIAAYAYNHATDTNAHVISGPAVLQISRISF